MAKEIRVGWRTRRSYAHLPSVVELPNLIETQQRSYQEFLQSDVRPERRKRTGLQDAFMSVFPIKGRDNSELQFISYSLGRPKYNIQECVDRGMTYAAALRIRVQLVIRESNKENPEPVEVRTEDIYLGDIPLMTERGTFVINGAERVVVSQLHRSPGPSFGITTHASGKRLVTASIIPNRGAWLEFETDPQEVVSVVIDRKRKMPITVLLRAFGHETDDEIRALFCEFATIHVTSKTPQKDLLGQMLARDVIDPDTGVVLASEATVIDKEIFERIRDVSGGIDIEVVKSNHDDFRLLHSTLAKDPCTHGQSEYTPRERALIEIYHMMRPGEPPAIKNALAMFENLFSKSRRYDLSRVGRYRMNKKLGLSLPDDCVTLVSEDLVAMVKYIFKVQRGEGITDDIDHLGNRRVRTIGELLENQFRAGLARMEKSIREKMGILDLESVMPRNLVNAKAITSAVNEFFGRSQLSQFLDQINPLAELTHKRRLSALGPGGLNRDRAGFDVRDVHHTHYGRICPIETPEGPNIGLISSLAAYARINQYGFIETPYRKVSEGRVQEEIVYLSADDEETSGTGRARRRVGEPSSGIFIAQANAEVDEDGRFAQERVLSRHVGEFPLVRPEDVTYMDVSPMQLVSVSSALIPFLEHDDANRALMGSNMQRQAVPLLRTEAPLVGTGIEYRVAKDSCVVVTARRGGTVIRAAADEIIIDCGTHRDGTPDHDRYPLQKFLRSNQNTCMNQRPIVRKGQTVMAGDVIADGPATDMGELALGKNVLVAFMSWEGYNFEDAILVSERLIRDDVFTSIHIEEFKTEARDTKLGEEEITRDIPNVGEDALRNLDENGIIRIGARVKPGDILVGKVAPKGKTQTTNVEKLLRAIFGKRAEDVRDISLKAPPGTEGIVVDVKGFSRKIKGVRSKAEEDRQVKRFQQKRDSDLHELSREIDRRLYEALQGKTLAEDVIDPGSGEVLIPAGTKLTRPQMAKIEGLDLKTIRVRAADDVDAILIEYEHRREDILQEFDKQVDYLKSGDNLPPGVIKLVKVYVAKRRKLSVGDKMAGRHGNKGVVSKILAVEDMPFLEDGTPVDIVLNPLGVPSRMNVGQVLETHLGWAAKARGEFVATPVFDGARHYDIALGLRQASFLTGTRGETDPLARDRAALLDDVETLVQAGIALKKADMADRVTTRREILEIAQADIPMTPEEAARIVDDVLERFSKTQLYDGKTGEPFKERVMVGYIYMMKLNHLVDDKIHARSIGPYSLVTQQPLGGKAQFGGQRLGEMEVWALEAYGAAYTLQELLTVKSDDVIGRNKVYEAIVKGENTRPPGLPESFYVLIKELQSLGLDVELVESEEGETFIDKSRPSALQRRLAGEVV